MTTAAPGPPGRAPAELPVDTTDMTTDDAFLGGGLRILQPADGYRAGVDAVLLAAAVPAGLDDGARLLDLGAGVGTVGLCALRRLSGIHATLVEAEPRLVALARENVSRNRLADRAQVVVGDLTRPAAALGLAAETFDVVVANPPFHIAGRGTPAPAPIKAQAHAMPESALDDWVRAMVRSARPGGIGLMIHKADALAAILAAFDGRFGAIRVLPIHPRADAPAIRVIVACRKGSRAPLTLLPGLVLHADGHAFTPQAARILREGAALTL